MGIKYNIRTEARYSQSEDTKKEDNRVTKSEREVREYKSLFCDERYAKQAWRKMMGKVLEGSVKPLPVSYDPKTGEPTFQSQLDEMAYLNVKARLAESGLSREPMQAELIVESNILRARFSDATFNVLLDRTAGKVKEELTVNKSPFEELSDEELAILQEHRDKQKSNNAE